MTKRDLNDQYTPKGSNKFVRINLSFILLFLLFSSFTAWRSPSLNGNFVSAHDAAGSDLSHNSALEVTSTPAFQTTTTAQVNLPFVQQLAPTATPTLSPFDEGYPAFIKTLSATAEVQTTPTPTPIPPQGESVNFPIVVGAFVIISIVFLSWVVFGKK